MPFQLESNYKPRGDQAQAIAKLTKSLQAGNRHQTLLGVTGSGKTFTMANVIRELERPTLVVSHNKTLAAQLYSEFKQFFPRNAVEYFVSYFDYYQPEAYIPRSDTYIEKDSSINEEIERLRLSATSALLSRRDTIVVASVSCIYGITSPEDYLNMLLTVKRGQQISREAVLGRLIDMLYERNDMNFTRGRFRVRGDVVEIYPATADEEAIRLEFFGDEIDAITILPAHCSALDDLIGEHERRGIPVVTFHGDAPASMRSAFVGPNSHAAGGLAAEVLSKLMGGRGRILSFTGPTKRHHFSQRHEGFRAALRCQPYLE